MRQPASNCVVLDLDYHCGDGTSSIFHHTKEYYCQSNVYTCSIHMDPRVEYPHFTGHDELQTYTRTVESKNGTNVKVLMQNMNIVAHPDTDGQVYIDLLYNQPLRRFSNFMQNVSNSQKFMKLVISSSLRLGQIQLRVTQTHRFAVV